MPKLSHAFNVLISPEQHESLKKLAEANQCSIAALIRSATNIYINAVAFGQPLCANGQRCSLAANPQASQLLRSAPAMLPSAFQAPPPGA